MKFIITIAMALAFTGQAVAASVADDVARYVGIFSGDKSLHSDAADTFAWVGISDPAVFDIIEKRLLEEHEAATSDRGDKNRVARYIRSLGFSGQPKYATVIRQFATNRTYDRYAKAALEDLPQYQKWNPIISNRASFNPAYSDDVNRIMNMLRSDDMLLKEIAAKRIYYKNKEDVLLDMLAKEVRANYRSTDPRFSDSIAWMLKGLGNSKKPEYMPLLEEARDHAQDQKIRKYAQVALDYYK